MHFDFYLASQSSRRIQLLRDAGYSFEAMPADIEEKWRVGESPDHFVRRMAMDKAEAVGARADASMPLGILAADTVVAVDGRILGKPADREESISMLTRLSDRRHQVYTAVAACLGDMHFMDATCTEVLFGPISQAEAAAYWRSGEPQDKAGSYAIQGLAARWVREIHGSYTGVVGLPMFETIALLRRLSIEPTIPPA